MSYPIPPTPPEVDDGEEEPLLGAQAAANYLGLHRSTLFLAVKEGALIPDARTRGRHTRFRRSTLDAFRSRYTVGTATGETALASLLRALSELGQEIADAATLSEAAKIVVEQVQRALPGIDGVSVGKSGVIPGDPTSVHMLTPQAVPDEVLRSFERQRHTFRFGTTTALRTLEAEVSENTSSESLYTGTRNIARIWTLGAYAIYPIVLHGKARGLLFCTCTLPRRFSVADRTFLQALVNLLALAFERFDARDALRAAEGSAELLTMSLDMLRSESAKHAGRAELVARYRQLSGTSAVCTAGLGDELPCEGRLSAVVNRVYESEPRAEPEYDHWEENGQPVWGMALCAGNTTGRRFALGAEWRGEGAPGEHEARLLRTFGSLLSAFSSGER